MVPYMLASHVVLQLAECRCCSVQENEEFYACKWSVNPETGAPLLLLAGKRGLLKALDCSTEELSAVSAAGLLYCCADHCLHSTALCPPIHLHPLAVPWLC